MSRIRDAIAFWVQWALLEVYGPGHRCARGLTRVTSASEDRVTAVG